VTKVDVAVIGGGLGGLTAARELQKAGSEVLVLEARSRLGGRTWTDRQLDRQLEMGGAHVHWLQPFLWAEIVRYGLTPQAHPDPERVSWFVDGELHDGSFDDFVELLRAPLTELFARSRELFLNPYATADNSAAVKALDGQTSFEALEQLELTDEQRGVVHSFCDLQFHGRCEEGAQTQLLRWGALAGGDWQLMFEILGTYELVEGTGKLVESICADGGFAVRLEAPVTRVTAEDDGVTVAVDGGGEVKARAAVVAVPMNVLAEIDFDPPLPAGMREVAREGHTGRGSKVWAEVKGAVDPWFVFADQHPLAWVTTFSSADDKSLLLCFGNDAEQLDPNDHHGVQAALDPLLPGVELLRCTGHDWHADPYSRGTWAMLRPGQWTKLNELEPPDGPVFIAGSDFADGWAGLMDGAIESGLVAARRVNAFLATPG